MSACERCLARAWLLGRLGAHLELARGNISTVLSLADGELIEAVGGRQRREIRHGLDDFDPERARVRCQVAGVEILCRCEPAYPARLRALEAPPAVLHVAGGSRRFVDLATLEPVAIVGARKASGYGLEVARSLGRGLGAAGVTVLSGMALGIDSAAHAGALDAASGTVAVLPGGADRPYPPSKRGLYQRICQSGAAVSELPPGAAVWRWTFPARNRIIAALAALTIVVEAGPRSGALLTAGIARGLSRPVGAVPGRVTSPLAKGPNRLIATGAYVVQGPQDVLDALFGAGVRVALSAQRPPLDGERAALLGAIAGGAETSAALARAGLSTEDGLAALAELELGGYVRRGPGGRFSVVP